MNNRVVAVDLFCGVGGLTHGLAQAGIRVSAGVDVDEACRFPYEANNHAKFVARSVAEVTGADLRAMWGDAKHRVLAGCAPCQPFSSYSRSVKAGAKDSRWKLLRDFGALVLETEPEIVTMENVPQLSAHKVFRAFVRALKGYHVWVDVVNCYDFGVPQTRKRLVLLASRLGNIQLIAPTIESLPTVRDAIEHLPAIAPGTASSVDPLHTSPALSELNLRRIRASLPGGTWRDWEPSLRAACHRRESGVTYPSVYGRMAWDEPAPTVTTQCFGYGNGRFGHPTQDRAISLREAAILQSFPADYKFIKANQRARFAVLGRLIGNAVPVGLAAAIGRSIVQHLRENADTDSLM